MKILVTGGAGFIGSHIADALIDAGHEVVVIDNLSTGRREQVPPKAEFLGMDIRDEKLAQVFDARRFDVVMHQAAQMDVRKSVDEPMYDAAVNIMGTLNLLTCAHRSGVKKFMFASTGGAIYGEQTAFPAGEDHPTSPLSPYGIAKLAVEKYLWYFHHEQGLPFISLRYANVYGPRQSPHGEAGVIAIFAGKMINGRDVLINGDGRQTRDYVYVGDVVRANMLALAHGESGIFNVGTGVETDVNRLYGLLRQMTGAKSAGAHGPAKKGEQLRSVIDSSKLMKTFGWRPSVPLEEGLRATVEYFQRHAQEGA